MRGEALDDGPAFELEHLKAKYVRKVNDSVGTSIDHTFPWAMVDVAGARRRRFPALDLGCSA